jgi:hypothetical protein
MVPGNPQDIAAFLRAHAPPGIPNNGEAQLGTAGGQMISYDVIDAERGNSKGSPAELDITVAALGAGMAGIRADAEVVPAGATCAYSGGPAPVPAPAAHGNSVAGSSRLSSRPPKSPPPRSRANVTCYGTCLPAVATFVLIHGAGDAGWYWHLTEAETARRRAPHQRAGPALRQRRGEPERLRLHRYRCDGRQDPVIAGQSHGAFTATLVAAGSRYGCSCCSPG